MAFVTDKTGFVPTITPRSRDIPKAAPVRRKSRKLHLGTFGYGLPLLVTFFVFWEIAPRLGWLSPIFFPPLSEVLTAWYAMLLDGTL